MSPPFGLLLVGGNHTHQENYARALAADPRCRLIGLTDQSGVSARRQQLSADLARELQIPYLDDFDSAIRRSDVQLVSICADPERREEITIACAQAGKHLYLDKDPAPTVAAARRIGEVLRSTGVCHQAFSMVRTPATQRAKAQIQSGQLGQLVGLHCDITFAKGIPGTADLSQPRVEMPNPTRFTFIDSKREFLCIGYYALMLMQWLTGQRFRSVDAVTSNFFFAEHQRNDVEDFATVLGTLTDGTEVAITAGRCGWMTHRQLGLNDIRLLGTQGSVAIDGYWPRLEIFSDTLPWQQPTNPHPEDPMGFWTSTNKVGAVHPKTDWHVIGPAVQNDFTRFLDYVESGVPSDVPADLAIHSVEVVHAVYESAATRQTVLLD